MDNWNDLCLLSSNCNFSFYVFEIIETNLTFTPILSDNSEVGEYIRFLSFFLSFPFPVESSVLVTIVSYYRLNDGWRNWRKQKSSAEYQSKLLLC